MKPFRPFAFAALIVAFTLAVAGCGSDDDPWKDQTIPLGSLFSTTGDGVPFGPQQVKGAQLAVDEINSDNGVKGAQLTLIQRDDQSDPEKSAQEMKELIDEQQVFAVLGPTFSNSAAEADPIANERRTPVLAVSNTGPGIVGDCDYPCDFVFRDSLGEASAIPANVTNYVARENPSSARILFPADDPFGKTSADTAAKTFRQAGVTVDRKQVASDGSFEMTDDKVDVFMITASSGETGAAIAKNLREGKPDPPILGGNAFNSPLVARSLGEDGKGIQSASAWFAGNTSEENQEFMSAYRAKYGEAPDQFAAQSYTGVKLLAEAAEDADLSFSDLAGDREILKGALQGVKEETPLGEFSFTADHDVIQPIWIVAMDGQGGYTLVDRVQP